MGSRQSKVHHITLLVISPGRRELSINSVGAAKIMQEAQMGNVSQGQASIFRAAEYVRMSTEHQQYSTENQADKIREYAARHGIEIVKTYADVGKRG